MFSNRDFRHVVSALRRRSITHSHVSLLLLLERAKAREKVSIATFAEILSISSTTTAKKLRDFSENGIVEISPSLPRADSHVSVERIVYSQLKRLEGREKAVRGSERTQELKETISAIRKKVKDPVKRNFSTHPKYLRMLDSLLRSGVDLDAYVEWVDLTYSYFSLGLLCSSVTLDEYRKRTLDRESHEDREKRFWSAR